MEAKEYQNKMILNIKKSKTHESKIKNLEKPINKSKTHESKVKNLEYKPRTGPRRRWDKCRENLFKLRSDRNLESEGVGGVPRKERVGRSGWRLGDRLGVTVQRGVGSGGTFKAGGPTRTDSSKEQGGRLRGERERETKLRE